MVDQSTIDFEEKFTSNEFVAFMNNFKQSKDKQQMEDEEIKMDELIEESKDNCSIEQYMCDDCDKVFDELSELFAHHIHVHEHKNEKISFDCANCYMSFPKHFLFMKHLKHDQKKEENNMGNKSVFQESEKDSYYKCDSCGKSFSEARSLKKHFHIGPQRIHM